ncbi:SMI1/KNR4 family protein [Pseudenhygromyxa sp. WMMC2535]|uniref:SMI1/KNR4 family protein n=1 Tax=Pseudenhygromyxa sp. WMMC2535 TaxID=2712867 RepID=UPI0015563720|nr:SMI1/KNR4 family protein [Pseudenhygromyxa sp. WMMC2535]NVB38891.1 SMI1/KNR4 family protein [Pseudenhygromyxa sp. WMMC2535]
MQPLNRGLETLLCSLVSGADQSWQGASPEDLAQLEQVSGAKLPAAYRAFLARMGRDLGTSRFSSLDFSIAKIISCYEQGVVQPDERFLLIGWEEDDEMMPHVFYDLSRPIRQDALVINRDLDGSSNSPEFETFREFVAWSAIYTLGILEQPCHCMGSLTNEKDVREHLDPAMAAMGFNSPIETGPYCGLYREQRAWLTTLAPIEIGPTHHGFMLGGPSEAELRAILGRIATSTPLELEIETWSRDEDEDEDESEDD